MAYRLRRMEMQKENASKADFATLERACNMLADPYILAQYDNVLRDATAPVAFPYSGFGSLIVRGERSADSGVFFANQILAFLPERRHRTAPVPLRKLDISRTTPSSETTIAKSRFSSTTSCCRSDGTRPGVDGAISSSATVEISADFVRTGHYRKRGGEWQLIESETALPSFAQAFS